MQRTTNRAPERMRPGHNPKEKACLSDGTYMLFFLAPSIISRQCIEYRHNRGATWGVSQDRNALTPAKRILTHCGGNDTTASARGDRGGDVGQCRCHRHVPTCSSRRG